MDCILVLISRNHFNFKTFLKHVVRISHGIRVPTQEISVFCITISLCQG